MRSNWADFIGEVRGTPNVSRCAASSVLPQHDHRLALMPLVVRFNLPELRNALEPRAATARGCKKARKSQAVAGAFVATPLSLSRDCSSPDWNISRMMSQPPTNSPLT